MHVILQLIASKITFTIQQYSSINTTKIKQPLFKPDMFYLRHQHAG